MTDARKPVPKAMQAALDSLRAACDALPSAHVSAPVTCPIFGNTPPPAAPSTSGLPPMLAAVSAELARALAAPAGPMTWPLVDTPGIAAQRVAAKTTAAGRPANIKPHHVVRLVRFVKLGDSVRKAAAKAPVSERTARRILAGQHDMAHHPAVTAAGVYLPARAAANPPANSGKAPRRADQVPQAATPAPRASNASNAAPPELPASDPAEARA